MSKIERPPNSHECSYFGRKLSSTCCDDIGTSLGYVCIGSDGDDEIYFDIIDNKYLESKDMVKERVTITAIHDGMDLNDKDQGHYFDIDLEDVLMFAAKYCSGIYKRVLKESEDK